MDIVGSHPDQWELVKGLKSKAMSAGHQNPTVERNGLGLALTCGSCGGQTHVGQAEAGGDWLGISSPAHRLNTSGCNS
jgi:hypothetical protein